MCARCAVAHEVIKKKKMEIHAEVQKTEDSIAPCLVGHKGFASNFHYSKLRWNNLAIFMEFLRIYFSTAAKERKKKKHTRGQNLFARIKDFMWKS